MSRLRFPQDRTAFVYQDDYEPILTPPRTSIVVFTDEACTTPADIRSEDGTAIPNSTVFTEHGIVPEFLGPDGAFRLWAKPAGATEPYPLEAQVTELLSLEEGTTYRHVQAIPATVWTVAHNLGYRPASVALFSTDYATQWDEFRVGHVSENTLTVTTDIPVSGVALVR